MIHIYDDQRKNFIRCRALLDTCATANFITESAVKRLNLHVESHTLQINTINATGTLSKGIVQIIIQSTHNEFLKRLTCLTIPVIANSIPSEVFPRESIKIPANIKLADSNFHVPGPVDLLIGSGATLSLFSVGQINISKDDRDLYLQKTRLGWVVAGDTSKHKNSKPSMCCLTNLENQVTKFWMIEEIHADKPKSREEVKCETFFNETVSRNPDGRYTVRLPFRDLNKRIGESRSIALKRLLSLERKFNSNDILKQEYTKIIEEYKKLGHISVVEDFDDDKYYMPHHAVFKESSNTTKIRIVFDVSAKSINGTSLNDTLLVGPTIQDKLFEHLIRFRTYNYVISADIEKMYHQVWVHPEDRRYQRLLWRENGEIKTFQLNTLTFGVSSSPFLAIQTIKKLADDEQQTFPRAANILRNHLYVDDLLSGAVTIKEAREIRDEITALLQRGGFNIRQWASNDLRVINDMANESLHLNLTLDTDSSLKTLGVSWSTQDDKIYYSAHPIDNIGILTKRKILSEIAKIFDPIGLMGPIIIYAKKLMQDVWQAGIHWDESVSQTIYTEWSEFVKQLQNMRRVTFDRQILLKEYHDVQIHGFCDASSIGYGACIYTRCVGKDKKIISRLICSKSRVAPLKIITIPRLELCGALLLARLFADIHKTLNISPNRVIFWCDSTIVLNWLKTSPHLLKTYVANRVTEITEITDTIEWRHIRSEDNPADTISRGQLPRAFLQNNTWREGPSWLTKEESEWPHETIPTIKIPELKINTCLITTINKPEIFQKYSTFSKICRIIAYCLRFKSDNKYVGPLCSKEINEAEIRILKLLQITNFSQDIKEIKTKDSQYKGKFIHLNPFLDERGLMRVGGRLQNSKLLNFAQKHPILLPSRHQLTDKIIREIHEKHYHAGIQTTLYTLRQKYWILDGRNQVRKVIRSCIRCHRFAANTIEYKMGNLPSTRVCETIPFSNTGIDFCGPFYIKEKKYRNRTRIKVYVCIFVCMSIKAVHLEVVSDLSTDGFLATLRRFIARRGIPKNIYSDNGSNFVGANNQLREIYALLNSNKHQELVLKYASEHRLSWHFILPAAPHFGGLWESMVKLFKHHFKRVVGDSLFIFEELNTFTIQVEGILNSRPITSLSSDPNDLLALTPSHYLIGKPLTSLPKRDFTSVSDNRLSIWEHISKVRQDFWARWSLEYLNELQKRIKWMKDGPKIENGTVVLIKDKNMPCTQWTLGRIIQLHPGEDKVVRAATIKTANGELRRATKYLCPLPVD
ncbi:uncharacterized protein [Cardiocondyla obscurior]|uniref:uncharacterized protein n=1 Tax=Cardiocondyla obscurior TaxID=286306 RepID=UPI0039658BEF